MTYIERQLNLIVEREKLQAQRYYHKKNPHIYEEFERCTLIHIRMGFKHLSARHIIGVIRWETAKRAIDQGMEIEKFKVSNNITPFYSRLFMQTYPEHEGLFRMKSLNKGEVL